MPITNGLFVDPAVTQKRYPNLEHGTLATVEAIVLHQTAAPTAQHTFNAYGNSSHQYGAHFLIAKNGTIYQTARVDRVTWHVGRIRARCKETSTCTPAELRRIKAILGQMTLSLSQRYSQLHQHELGKGYPDRFPYNSDSIGIELVGNYNPTTSAFEAVSTAQQTSLTWLITELTKLLGISLTDIYRHPEILYKDPGEAAGATW